jgi:cystathionine gamma-lyase
MNDETRVIRAGLPDPEQGRPFLPGPTFAGTYHLRGEPSESESEYTYGRYGNPTWSAYERALGELERGEAVLFASGMAAVSALLVGLMPPGGILVLPSDCYMTVRALVEGHLAPRRTSIHALPTPRLAPDELPDELDLLWLETPSNPGLEVCDVAALSDAAHVRGALVAVDNTFATPLGQRPLELGADFSLTSVTKHLSGHADLLLGYVAARDPARADELREWRKRSGAIPGAFEAWLAHRSLATLALRLERQCANAAAIAELLASRDDVPSVRYPGLPADPGHALARRQMRRFGTIVSFDLGSRERAEAFLEAAELVTEATSFGSVHTTAERRARWGGDDVPAGFIRLSAGCEAPEDLLADIGRALGA